MKKTLALLLVFSMILAIVPTGLADWGGWGGWSGTNTYIGSTNLRKATASQLNNINLAARKLTSVKVTCDTVFSFNDIVGPRTADYGYKNALNGRGVYVRGGGTGQVASAIYLAARQVSGIRFEEIKNYGDDYTGSYVSTGEEAIVVDYKNKNDFSFRHPSNDLLIEVWVTSSEVMCRITVSAAGSSSPSGADSTATIYLTGTNTLKNNVSRAASSINGYQLSYYDEFSFNQLVGPRTERNGYGAAINGRGVRVMGGGVAQVASVIYLAIKDLNYIRVTDLRTYEDKYNQSYVYSADDAVLTDYANNIDFRFRYTGYRTLTINVYVDNNRLICDVFER